MNPENQPQFKDKEIEKLATEIKKTDRKEFGETFKSAANRLGTDPEPPKVFGNPISTRIDQLVPPPTVISSLSDESQLTPEKKELYSIVKPLRTYERDVAEAGRSKNESVASVKRAEEEKKVEQIKKGEVVIEKTERATKKGLILVISLVLMLAGIGIAGLVFNFYTNKPEPIVQGPIAIITTDAKESIDITNKQTSEILSLIQQSLIRPRQTNGLIRIDLTENNNGEQKIISAQSFFELFGKSAPSSLGRALGSEWVFGIHAIGNIKEPFIFTRVSSFDNAYDGMIRFEQNITTDFEPLFIKPTTLFAISTSTNPQFEDVVIKSKDTRVLKDRVGNIVLLYSFLDLKTLVVTTNETTFRELLNRYFSSQVIR